MGDAHRCPHCRWPLTLTMELGKLAMRCESCRMEQIVRDSRYETDRREGYTKPWWTGKGEY